MPTSRQLTRWQELFDAITDAEITPSDFRVYMTLLKTADYGSAEIPVRFQPRSLIKLAERCHISLAGVKRSVGHLQRHGWLERHIISLMDTGHPTGESMPEDSRAANGVHAALNWMDAHKVRWVFTERKVYSLRHDYAGTGDGLAYISSCGNPECCGKWVKTYGRWERVALKFTDALALIDWKTSNQLHASYDWQTAGYDKAVEEEIGIHGKFPMLQQLVEYRVIIKLGKDDGEFDARLLTMDTLERDFTTFLQCLDLYRSTDSVEQEDKQRKRELRQQEREDREAANLIACPKSGEFKGFRYPKCNGGEPCATCLAKYNERQAAKAVA